jgi:hypothetical protein
MAEQQETGFKVTDRRKYNPDGSPRAGVESETEAQATPSQQPQAPPKPAASPVADNVVSFPGETKKQPEPAPDAGPPAAETKPSPPPRESTPAGRAEQAYNQASGPRSARLPEASFLSLANMLAVEAAMHLGLIQSQGEEPPPVDLEAARHLIDMLGMLQTKTRGNLTSEEDNLLENILADLRMQFVAISKRR